MKHRDSGRPDGDVRQAKTPGAAKRVADDDGDALAGAFAKGGGQIFRGLVGIPGKQGYDVVVGNIRMVDSGIGADVAVTRFGNQHGIAANEAFRFVQDHFHKASVFLLPVGDDLRFWGRHDRFQIDDSTFSL